jgi:hypothetical protein
MKVDLEDVETASVKYLFSEYNLKVLLAKVHVNIDFLMLLELN